MIDLSIIIPAYNEEKYLKDTLISLKNILNSFELNTEIIVKIALCIVSWEKLPYLLNSKY